MRLQHEQGRETRCQSPPHGPRLRVLRSPARGHFPNDYNALAEWVVQRFLSTYLTRWALPESKFDNNKVTVRRLRSHTAGLTYGLGCGGFAPNAAVPSVEELKLLRFRGHFSSEKESEMPTPKPPYPVVFRQQMVELVRAGRGISDAGPRVRLQRQQHSRVGEGRRWP